MNYFFTSESVGQGHPDKVADQISDAIVDQFLAYDKNARVACETMVTTGQVVIAGEVRSKEYVDLQQVARDTINKIGYTKSEYQFDGNSCGVLNAIHEQSSDIAQGVDNGDEENQGAGDQGIMFGYAVNETETYMPLTAYLANMIVKTIDDIRKEGKVMRYLRPDSKSQVTIEYNENGVPLRINNIVVSVQHDEFDTSDKFMQKVIEEDIRYYVFGRMCKEITLNYIINFLRDDFKLLINPTGKFVIGGPHGDTGLTGRKIIVDTYGGRGAHGGGAFCVDGDTEYLTRNGWKKISEYNGEEVAQWDNGELTFVKPFAYHKHPAEKMYHIYNAQELDMVLSEHHNIVLTTSKGNIVKKLTKDVIDLKNSCIKNGNNGSIPCYFNYNGGDGISLTDDEIRLQIAFCADGTIINGNKQGRIRIKKEYKKERLVKLLESTKTDYKVAVDNSDTDFLIYYFVPPIISKSLANCFQNVNKHQIGVIAEELIQWDGDRKSLFRTTIKEDADFAQFIFIAHYGTNASITMDNRIGEIYERNGNEYIHKSILYTVNHLKYKEASFRMSTKKTKHRIYVDEFVPSDGFMYCFTVPSSVLILRRNNRVFITGNCGKDSSKVDRSAAYMARYIAKNMVAAHISDEVLVQISYAIGKAEPMSVYVNTYGKSHVRYDDGEIADKIKELFDLRPKAIERKLKLRQPMFLETAAYGHMGRKNEIVTKKFTSRYHETKEIEVELFTWEKLDSVDLLKKEFGL